VTVVKFLYLIIRILEVAFAGFFALLMFGFAAFVAAEALSDGDRSLVSVAPMLAPLAAGAFAVWLFRRRLRVGGRDELFGRTGIDLSERGYVIYVLTIIAIFAGLATWMFNDDLRFPKGPPEDSEAPSVAPESSAD
jgi:hypothetical protein